MKVFDFLVGGFIGLCLLIALFIAFKEVSNYNHFINTNGKLCVIENIKKGRDSCSAYRLCELKHGSSSVLDSKYCNN